MFTVVYADDLHDFPTLANQMFRDRRAQFHDAYGWALDVDGLGREIDRYDLMNPLYVILTDGSGRHVGSGRLMPTTGPTMIAEHFSDLTDGVEIVSPLIWEVTRVFIASRSRDSMRNAAALFWAGCKQGLAAGVEFFVGVTAASMVPVFTVCGWKPEVIGRRSAGADGEICACLWELNEDTLDSLAHRAGFTVNTPDLSIYRRKASVPTPFPPAWSLPASTHPILEQKMH